MSSKDFRVCVFGSFGSGRTAWIQKFKAAAGSKQVIKALRAESYTLKVHTSAGAVELNIYDSTLHAKGGLPDQAFFRSSDAGVLMYDTTSADSYKALEEWYDAFQSANGRKGSAPIPIIVVGTKIDDAKGRETEPKDVDFPRKKELKYMEISSKGNWNVKELLVEVLSATVGDGTQLTDNVEITEASAEVDEQAAEKAMKEYEEAGSA